MLVLALSLSNQQASATDVIVPGTIDTMPTDEGPAACHRQSDSSVICNGPSFKILIDQCVMDHADSKALKLELSATTADLTSTRAALAVASVPRPAPSSLKPVVGLIAGIIGGSAIGVGAAGTSLSSQTRLGLGVAGLLFIAASVVVVVPWTTQ